MSYQPGENVAQNPGRPPWKVIYAYERSVTLQRCGSNERKTILAQSLNYSYCKVGTERWKRMMKEWKRHGWKIWKGYRNECQD